jgi:hypothetical protein
VAVQEQNTLANIAKQFTPNLNASEVAIAAPGDGPGFWVGGSSAIEVDGVIYIAYRTRQPIELGRGQGVIIAKSSDGIHFEELCTVSKESMDAESLERPSLIRTPEGKWRLYLSCATTGTKHWRVELIEADDPSKFTAEERRVVMPGDEKWGVKDTVIQLRDGVWHCWATMHPLDIANAEDRMVSDYATSQDGVEWQWHGTCLSPDADSTWDARGRRITAVHFANEGVVAFYDGRANAQENYDERTGIATGSMPNRFESISPDGPVGQSPDGKALRYLDLVPLANGGHRIYYEVALPNGSHELRTELR